ncbi:MAG: hypothetical protein MZV63_36250 [Marinilabiliales bacterium]|nr:hypothetical protein [Marinilabiliales bacterium]
MTRTKISVTSLPGERPFKDVHAIYVLANCPRKSLAVLSRARIVEILDALPAEGSHDRCPT